MKNGLTVNEVGTKCWYLNDKLHRTDGPAIEHSNGNKYWYLNGKRHRTDGPAIEHSNGSKHWYINGVGLSEKEYLRLIRKKKLIEILGV